MRAGPKQPYGRGDTLPANFGVANLEVYVGK